MEIKFSFGNCLDDDNAIVFDDSPSSRYLPQIRFKNLHWMDDLAASVVDENLQVHGHPGLYVCDLSVLPFSSAANPVCTLAVLALGLSEHLVTA